MNAAFVLALTIGNCALLFLAPVGTLVFLLSVQFKRYSGRVVLVKVSVAFSLIALQGAVESRREPARVRNGWPTATVSKA